MGWIIFCFLSNNIIGSPSIFQLPRFIYFLKFLQLKKFDN